MLAAGDAFLIPDEAPVNSNQHLWIILSDTLRNPAEVLLASITTWEHWKDDTCLLTPEDCEGLPFVKHTSCVDYRRARIESSATIEKLLSGGSIKHYGTISAGLLEKIRHGARQSVFLPNKCQLFLDDQGLLDG